MNDFTKEELEDIVGLIELACDFMIDRGIGLCDSDIELKKKIQSLIDNDCEHEFKRELMQIDLCDKCKKFKFVFVQFDGK